MVHSKEKYHQNELEFEKCTQRKLEKEKEYHQFRDECERKKKMEQRKINRKESALDELVGQQRVYNADRYYN